MNYKGIIEGLLFVYGDEGLDIKTICEIVEIDENIATTTIKQLYNDYENNDRGIHLEFLGNKFKLTTKPEHDVFYKKIVSIEQNTSLSQSALETLAIIAYNGPITRNQIDNIRGVNSSYVIRKLLLKGLITESGRSEEPGRPKMYNITPKFLDHFGLGSIKDLPKIEINTEIEDIDTNLFNSKYKEDI